MIRVGQLSSSSAF